MATIEERLTAIEQENAALKKSHETLMVTVELQAAALRALSTKEDLNLSDDKDEKVADLQAQTRLTQAQMNLLNGRVMSLNSKVTAQSRKIDQILLLLNKLTDTPQQET